MQTRKHTTTMKRRGNAAVSKWVMFAQETPPVPTIQVQMHPDKWEDMGRPDTLTVIVEGGDLLNADH